MLHTLEKPYNNLSFEAINIKFSNNKTDNLRIDIEDPCQFTYKTFDKIKHHTNHITKAYRNFINFGSENNNCISYINSKNIKWLGPKDEHLVITFDNNTEIRLYSLVNPRIGLNSAMVEVRIPDINIVSDNAVSLLINGCNNIKEDLCIKEFISILKTISSTVKDKYSSICHLYIHRSDNIDILLITNEKDPDSIRLAICSAGFFNDFESNFWKK